MIGTSFWYIRYCRSPLNFLTHWVKLAFFDGHWVKLAFYPTNGILNMKLFIYKQNPFLIESDWFPSRSCRTRGIKWAKSSDFRFLLKSLWKKHSLDDYRKISQNLIFLLVRWTKCEKKKIQKQLKKSFISKSEVFQNTPSSFWVSFFKIQSFFISRNI